MMHTYQIATTVLESYVPQKLSEERISLLLTQAKEQLEEIAQNEALYTGFLNQVGAPKEIDTAILWILVMSDEDLCCEYIDVFDKDFREVTPVSDLADLLLYVVHLEKVKGVKLEGFDYLLEYDEDGMQDVDQYCFTDALLYIQKSKEVQIEF